MADYPDDPGKTPADEQPVPQPPAAIRRPDTANNPPSDQYPDPSISDRGKALETQLTEAQEALRQQLEDQKRLEGRANDFARDYQNGMKEIQQEISQADKDRAQPPQLLPMQEADMHSKNQLQWSWPNTLFTLGIALLGTMGKHGHGTLSNYFLGSFFQAYAAGQQERMKQMELGWHQTNEAIYRENELRLSEYRSKLADERLSLDSKIQVMKNLADQYKDLPMLKAIQSNNLTAIRTQLTQAERALHDFRTEQQKARQAQQQLMKRDDDKGYRNALKAVFEEHHPGRYPITEQDWAEAASDYPYLEYLKQRKTFGVDIKGEPLGPNEKASPSPTPGASASPTPSPTPTDQDLDDAIRKYESQQR